MSQGKAGSDAHMAHNTNTKSNLRHYVRRSGFNFVAAADLSMVSRLLLLWLEGQFGLLQFPLGYCL